MRYYMYGAVSFGGYICGGVVTIFFVGESYLFGYSFLGIWRSDLLCLLRLPNW